MIQAESKKTQRCCKTQQNATLKSKRDFLKKMSLKKGRSAVKPIISNKNNLGLIGRGVAAPLKMSKNLTLFE